MKERKAVLTVTIPPELKDKVKAMADKENRNLSNMTETLLLEALKNKAA